MRVDFLAQAGKLLKEQKQYRRRAVVFLCLAVVVMFGTVTALKLYGQAMTHKVEVLDCCFKVHEHTDDCYERDAEGNQGTESVCGYADYVVHVHNDRCYDGEGNLTCGLEEQEAHQHTEECYATEKLLVCGMETENTDQTADGGDETGGTDAAGNPEDTAGEGAADSVQNPEGATGDVASGEEAGGVDQTAEPACGVEAHIHTEECYENAVVCGFEEEHIHDGTCAGQELACELGEHTHAEGCYDAEGNVVCGTEEHMHLTGCYDGEGSLTCSAEPHTHDGNCQDAEGNIVCGLGEHIHIIGCFREVYTCGKEAHTHEEVCHTSNLVCGKEEHEHSETCYAQAGEEAAENTAADTEGTAVPPAEAGDSVSTENTDPAVGSSEAEGTTESGSDGNSAPGENGTQGHVHTEDCYEEVTTLLCGKLELHTHDDSCYAADCFDGEGNLLEGSVESCGLPQLEEHVHGEDCFKTVELTPEEVAALNNGAKLHIHEDSCYDEEGSLICGHEATHIHVLECYDEAGQLICGYGTAAHVHEDKCYDAAGGLICGYETATHVHEDSCYDAEGNLHCGYETASHGHETGCYDAEGNLVCGYETASHPHDESCYDTEGNLVCGYGTANHVHQENCHDAEGNLVCGYETASHPHDENCYDTERNLICGYETAKHMHEESCYDTEGNLVCGYEDEREHEHDSNCYDEEGTLVCGNEDARDHEHTAGCYDGEGSLTCGYEGVRDHEHDAECKDGEGSFICGYEGAGEHEHDAKCRDGEGSLICGYEDCRTHEHDAECYDIYDELVCGYEGAENHVHGEECYDEDGNLACGYELLEEYAISRMFRGEGYTVVAKYNEDAMLPEEARLIVEEITADSDKEHYERRETEYREMMDDEAASMRALLKIGFYVESEEGLTEVEPETPVMVSVQFLDEDGLPDGSPVTVVHFAEDGTEMLDGGSAVDNSTTFKMGSFSEIAIGYIEEEDPRDVKEAEDGTMRLHLADSFEYKDKAFRITFYVEGEAILPKGVLTGKNTKKNSKSDLSGEAGSVDASADGEELSETESEETADADTPADDQEAAEEEADTSEEAEESAESDIPAESEESAESDVPAESEESVESDASSDAEDPGNYIDIHKLKFKVEQMSTESEEYKAFLEHTVTGNGIDELYRMQVLTYSLTYEDEELDLSECKITVEIRPAQELQDAMGQSVTDGVAYLLNTDGEAVPEVVEFTPDDVSYSMEIPEAEEGAESDDAETEAGEEEEVLPEENPSEQTDNAPQYSASDAGGTEAAGNGVDTISLTVMAMAEDGPADLVQMDYDGAEDAWMKADLTGIQVFAAQASGQPNPKFTVQYYANLEKVAFNDDTLKENIDGTNTNELPVIDTSGGKLPVNGNGGDASPNGNAIRKLYVDTQTGKLKTKTELTEVYTERPYEYHKAPTINYINALIENASYELKKVWVLKEGKDPKSTAEDDWNIYDYNENLHFTNRKLSEGIVDGQTYVYIADNSIIRLVYDTTELDKDFQAAFYDYDIGDGKIYENEADAKNGKNGKSTSTQGTTKEWYMRTGQQGINSSGNYTKSGAKFAFGNANTGSGLQHEQWSGNLLNKNNTAQGGHPTVSGSYKGCTFGLAASLVNGKIQYAEGITVPNLFNDGAATGKTAYDNNEYSLKFNRVGDTHTLTAVNGTGTNNLDSFNHPSPDTGKVHNHIWTNNFWPMDSAGSYGTNGHDMKFGDYGRRGNYKFAGLAGSSGGSAVANGTFPWSDDGQDHNSYFGMHYKVEFDLVADYTGPLEYYFFGDDDMWVFLGDGDGNGTLVCDIGGVHSSVGEYLNLWDYINKEEERIHRHDEEKCYGNGIDQPATCGYVDSKTFTLNFFYTERGESGSTCWMQFTLPSVSSLTPETTDSDYGHLRVEKDVKVLANGQEYDPEDLFEEDAEQNKYFREKEFTFELTLQGPSGSSLKDDYAYVKYDKNGNVVSGGGGILAWETIANGEEFTLKDGEYIKIQYLPVGSTYTVTELNDIGIEGVVYQGTVIEQDSEILPEDDNKKVEGEVPGNSTSEVKYTNKYSAYELPETGGSGKNLYTMAGGMALLLGAGFLYKKKFRERRA